MIRDYIESDIKKIELIGNRIKNNYQLKSNDFSNALVYEDNGILGFLLYSNIQNEVEIIDIAVKEEFEGNGIGTKLLTSLFNGLKDAKSISLEVREDNEQAIRFYEKNGFKKSHLRKNYYDDSCNAIAMIKEL